LQLLNGKGFGGCFAGTWKRKGKLFIANHKARRFDPDFSYLCKDRPLPRDSRAAAVHDLWSQEAVAELPSFVRSLGLHNLTTSQDLWRQISLLAAVSEEMRRVGISPAVVPLASFFVP
jgi:hypothetical protein